MTYPSGTGWSLSIDKYVVYRDDGTEIMMDSIPEIRYNNIKKVEAWVKVSMDHAYLFTLPLLIYKR